MTSVDDALQRTDDSSWLRSPDPVEDARVLAKEVRRLKAGTVSTEWAVEWPEADPEDRYEEGTEEHVRKVAAMYAAQGTRVVSRTVTRSPYKAES